MNITLKNFKHAEFASEETYCFQATVYLDGKKVGVASNEGHGGSTNFYPHTGFSTLDGQAMENAIDTEVHKLVCQKKDKSILTTVKKELSKSICFRRKDTPAGTYRIFKGAVGTPSEASLIQKLKADADVVVIFNCLTLEQAAKAMYPTYKTV
jgi:hypothetical protein